MYKELKDNWDADSIGTPFPMKEITNNKDQYTITFIKARELWVAFDPNWVARQKH